MNDFRSGVCNTLIATCVAEEGIDVGEVDLIICFDVTNRNPTRFVQRIGRTGRKRQGKVIMLVTEGKEQSTLKGVMATRDETNQRINKSAEVERALYRHSPRLIPPEYRPQCVETFIQIKQEEAVVEATGVGTRSKKKAASEAATKKKSPVRKGKATAKAPKDTVKMKNMREFFQPVELDEQEREVFEAPNISNHDLETELNVLNDSLRNISANSMDLDTNAIAIEPCENDRDNSTIVKIPFAMKAAKLIERYRTISNNVKSSTSEGRLKRIIANDKVPHYLKLHLLRKDRDFVAKFSTATPTQSNVDLKKSVEQVFGGRRKVQQFLREKSEQWSDLSESRQQTIFEMLTALTIDKCDESAADKESAEMLIIPIEASTQVDYIIDSELEMPVMMENNSRYESQRHTLLVKDKAFAGTHSSTPIRKATPKMDKIKSPVDSPIARAFERTLQKNKMKNESEQISAISAMKAVQVQSNPVNDRHLQYLGLTCIDDLFADDDDDDDDAAGRLRDDKADTFVKPSIPHHKAKGSDHSKAVGVSNEISDIFADDIDEIPASQNMFSYEAPLIRSQRSERSKASNQTDYGVVSSGSSDKENHHNGSTSINTNSDSDQSHRRRKKLFIGTVSDLFADDDSEPDEPVQTSKEDTIPKSDETMPKSDSDCTEEYDFDEIMYNSSRLVEEPAGAAVSRSVANLSSLLAPKDNVSGNVSLRTGAELTRNDSEDIFAMSDSSKSNKSFTHPVALHKDSLQAQFSHSSATSAMNMSMAKSVSLMATSSTSFIGKAEANPSVMTSSPKNSISSSRIDCTKAPSVPCVYSSGLGASVNSKQEDYNSKGSMNNTSNVRMTPSFASPPRNASAHADALSQVRSPSMIKRRPNLSRLRRNEASPTATGSFVSCKPATDSGSSARFRSPEPISDDDFEQPQNVRSKLSRFSHNANVFRIDFEQNSFIHRPLPIQTVRIIRQRFPQRQFGLSNHR